MNKKLLKQIVLGSYTNNQLYELKVNRFVGLLNRKDLREYIKALKVYDKQKYIIVDIPNEELKPNEELLSSIFPNKKILYNITPGLLMGLKVIDNDIVYDFSLKNTLSNIQKYIDDNYD